ncbi:hypothetical protein CRV00_02675 [Malaciobacter molluscorum]|uniref:DUF6765 family protein n=1 Tax=Malaciobacter molluscorum TaxID=1032072 RepID=UPI00100ABE25|nr:DUF6765 family protein [Malaciobacter molluscorum]RXJ96106.1 hypothetical protein CRV00_02675 [Malaciobacter molluscorum]
MDYDIHYYGTYAAARIAGWNEDEAENIANAALFVDYCDYSKFAYTYFIGDKKLGVPVITSQYLSSYEMKDKSDPSIWVPFHFLPGNYKKEKSSKNHIIREEASNIVNNAYICRPYSILANDMIENTKKYYDSLVNINKLTALNLIGLRMHVFADTWAHQDFSGFNQKEINDCGYCVSEIESKDKRKSLKIDFSQKKSDYQAAPPKTNSYMGHGRLGHLPDIGWLHYCYEPAWKNKYMHERDNKKEFKEAFTEMIRTLHYFKTGMKKNIDFLPVKLKEIDELLKNNLSSNTLKVPSSFLDIIIKKQIMGDEKTGTFPSSANNWCDELIFLGLLKTDPLHKLNKKWDNEFIKKYLKDIEIKGTNLQGWKCKANLTENSNFLCFQEAASLHLDFIMNSIEKESLLSSGYEKLSSGWSVTNSESFRSYVRNKYSNL